MSLHHWVTWIKLILSLIKYVIHLAYSEKQLQDWLTFEIPCNYCQSTDVHWYYKPSSEEFGGIFYATACDKHAELLLSKGFIKSNKAEWNDLVLV